MRLPQALTVLVTLLATMAAHITSANATARYFERSTANGSVHATQSLRGVTAFAGDFDRIGGVPAQRVAQWDGFHWTAMHLDDSTYRCAYDITVFEDQFVVAAEGYTDMYESYQGTVTEDFEHRVLKWNGSTWTPMGDTLPNVVRALAVHEGELYAGLRTSFENRGESPLYKWDGQTWVSCGTPTGVPMVNVRSLQSHGGRLFVGGSFFPDIQAGAFPQAVYEYDEGTWSPTGDAIHSDQLPLTPYLPFGIQGVHDMAVFQAELHVTGNFVQEGTAIAGLAKWNGVSWERLPSIGTGHNMIVHDDRLVVVGVIAHATITGSRYFLGAWNGSSWDAVDNADPAQSPTDPTGIALASHGNDLIVCQDYSPDSNWRGLWSAPPAPTVRAWSGASWRTLIPGESPSAPVRAFIEHEDQLIVGGEFQFVGGQAAASVATWDGQSWSHMGRGLDPVFLEGVEQFINYQGTLVASGAFAVDDAISNIAQWDGTEWQPLAEGLEGHVQAVIEFEGKLVAATSFDRNNINGHSELHAWDGAQWTSTLPDATGGHIFALAIYNDELIAAGSFTNIGGIMNTTVARWTNGFWQPVDPTIRGQIETMAVFEGDLYMGGRFVPLINGDEYGLAVWTGTGSASLMANHGVSTHYLYKYGIDDMVVSESGLHVTGLFGELDGYSTPLVATWDGTQWRGHSYSDGNDNAWRELRGLSIGLFQDRLYVGGVFQRNVSAEDYTAKEDAWYLMDVPRSTAVAAASVGLTATAQSNGVRLQWNMHNVNEASSVRIDRSFGNDWHTVWSAAFSELASRSYFHDDAPGVGDTATYRMIVTMGGVELASNDAIVQLPPSLALSSHIRGNTPNPFNPSTRISFSLSVAGHVQIDVYDLTGRHVRNLKSAAMNAGNHEIIWNGKNDSGRSVASGIYNARLVAPDAVDVKRMTLLK